MATRARKRAKTAAAAPNDDQSAINEAFSPLPLPTSFPILDKDVTGLIVAFLDITSCCAAAGVSKGFRNALIPRQKAVALKNFQSYNSMKRMGFASATFLSCRDSSLATNSVLCDIGENPTSFPRLTGIDLSGCQEMNVNGVRRLVKGIGTRLERVVMNASRRYKLCKNIRITESIIKVFASAPNLKSLNLILPTKCKENALMPLEGKESLMELVLDFEGFTRYRLPRNIPNLEHLTIRTGPWTRFEYAELMRVQSYPSLKSLTIEDHQDGNLSLISPHTLSSYVLVEFMSKAPNLERIVLRRAGAISVFATFEDNSLEHLCEIRNVTCELPPRMEQDY